VCGSGMGSEKCVLACPSSSLLLSIAASHRFLETSPQQIESLALPPSGTQAHHHYHAHHPPPPLDHPQAIKGGSRGGGGVGWRGGFVFAAPTTLP